MIAFRLSMPDPTECAGSDGNRISASMLETQQADCDRVAIRVGHEMCAPQ